MFLNASLGAALDRIADRAADVRRAFTPGAMPEHDDVATPQARSRFTLDPLCATAPEGAYFVTRDARGRTAYTRDGAFAVRDGQLVDGAGVPVLGVKQRGDALEPLALDPVDATLGRARNVRVEPDGSVAYDRAAIDPRTGAREMQRVTIGRIALARFPAATRLESADGSHGFAPRGVEPYTSLAGEDGFGTLAPMQRERSRVDLDESLVRLDQAYHAFDALQAAQTAKGRTVKTTMDLLK